MVRKYFIKEIVIAVLLLVGVTISVKQYKSMAKDVIIQKVEEIVKPAEDIKETIETELQDMFIQDKESEGSDGR